MKKLVLLTAILLFVAGIGFAQSCPCTNGAAANGQNFSSNGAAASSSSSEKRDFFNMEITVGIPVHWSYSDANATANSALGLACLFNFTDTFGVILDSDFFFGAQSNFTSLWGLNLFLGPVFYLYNGEFLRVPLAIGGHFRYWYTGSNIVGAENIDEEVEVDGEFTDITIGPAIIIGVQFHFDRNIYIASRTTVGVDIYNIKSGDANLSWHIKPTLGLGIKF